MLTPARLAERICLMLLLALLWVPALAYWFSPLPVWVHPWLRSSSLGGTTEPKSPQSLSWRTFQDRSFQDYVEWAAGQHLLGREGLIRWANEAHFRAFHQTSSPLSTVSVGRQDTLFETDYLKEYFLERGVEPEGGYPQLPLLMHRLQQIQQACRKNGTGFLVVISPSKAALCPELTPSGWSSRFDPRPRFCSLLLDQLQKRGIATFDGRVPSLQSRSSPLGDIAFPKGGTHWGDVPAFLTASVCLEKLSQQGLPIRPLVALAPTMHDGPRSWDDQDLLRLLNLVYPWRYPCASLPIEPGRLRPSQKLSMVVLGGSFTTHLVDYWSASRQFSEIDFYYYRLTSKRCYVDGVREVRSVQTLDGGQAQNQVDWVPITPRPLDFGRDILAADALVLEINESSQGDHLLELGRHFQPLPEHSAPLQFGYESFVALPFDRPLAASLAGGAQATEGSLRLLLPDARHDVLLALELASQHPRQSLQIRADDQPLQEVVLWGPSPRWVEVQVPRRLIAADGRLLVDLASQAGIQLSQLRLSVLPDR